MQTTLIILAVIIGLFVIWWVKGMREAYVLKDKVIFILVSKYGLNRTEAKLLFDQNQRFVVDLHEMNTSPSEIAQKLYNTF
ncbi:hypothetical protein NC796_09495 [Aliifodinibius sp. S!AR15-10]|uniref:hypothetical protein n=1 Tax=Aliifodinibius sp. S!AR15-10 TaxID=2950437 RepID=UPI00285ACB55|nr:hypothetical protein [Aliifodinibius sp. S!AR15-10]MDR8391371.1 hypothetical protein [Aliifodinibius sp. S!AR15-10]